MPCWGGVALQFATGFTVAFVVYQLGTLITAGSVGVGFLPGLDGIVHNEQMGRIAGDAG